MKKLLNVLALTLCGLFPLQGALAQNVQVFETLATYEGPLEVALNSAKSHLESGGFEILSDMKAGVPDGCTFPVAVIAYRDPQTNQKLLEMDPQTAPYALVNRVVLFEDETGGHIAFVNPKSIYRTVFEDNPEVIVLAEGHRDRMKQVFQGSSSHAYGQTRDKGYIGKTMGVMAGGTFSDKIETLLVVPKSQQKQVSDLIQQQFGDADGKWGLDVAFRFDLDEQNAAILGIAGREMEAKSFSIVGAGSDKSRKELSCPGTAYAAAYPLEIVALQVGEDVHIQLVSAMFRMKMYFEDAGKWAFMKNMGMPGSLTSEIKDRIERVLK
ncbi:hypothetical protein HQ496_06965 [bacterium]|nr:hypothetical protein [bacterium]